MPSPAIFVATDKADRHRELISAALGEVPVGVATAIADVTDRYGGESVVLGRPDYLVPLLQTAPPVQWVQSTWAGVTPLVNLDFRDYQLTGVKDIFGQQMGEYILGYVLAHELKIEARRKTQLEKAWDETSSGRVAGKVFGVMGTGSIGAEVGAMAQQLDMELLGYNSTGNSVAPFDRVYSRENLNDFLAQCDYVVGILPDLPGTTDLLNADALAAMKNSALLINVGRGNLIDEQALCAALAEGVIAGAVLDVFKEEPLPSDNPLWAAPNCVITGHVAAVSHPEDVSVLFLQNYELFSSGKPLLHVVDFERGY